MADVALDCAMLERGGVTLTRYSPDSVPPLRTTDRYLVENNGRMSVFVETEGDPTTVTIAIPQTLDGQPVTPREVNVAANQAVGIGGFPPDIYNDAAAKLALSFSSVTGVKLFCACLS